VHDPDDPAFERAALEEVLPALCALRDEGAISMVGAGMNQCATLERLVEHADLDVVMLAGRYTLLEQGPLARFFPACERRGVRVLLGGVFNSGVLATGARPGAKYQYADAPGPVLGRVRALEALCERHGASLKAVALAFAGAHPAVATLVLGAASAREVRENARAAAEPVPRALWQDLRASGLIDPLSPLPGDPEPSRAGDAGRRGAATDPKVNR
jgi:D-threo-aldose 1-dehydrogenase